MMFLSINFFFAAFFVLAEVENWLFARELINDVAWFGYGTWNENIVRDEVKKLIFVIGEQVMTGPNNMMRTLIFVCRNFKCFRTQKRHRHTKWGDVEKARASAHKTSWAEWWRWWWCKYDHFKIKLVKGKWLKIVVLAEKKANRNALVALFYL